MGQSPVPTATRIVRRSAGAAAPTLDVEICVVGAGIAGVSAALEAARLGRRVALVDGLPALGGQAVNSVIGTFCGLFSNGTHGYQLTHGIADDILRELGREGALHYRRGPMTTVVMYDEVALARWINAAVRAAGIVPVLGAILRGVEWDGRRIARLQCATRFGDLSIAAQGFVDASGDAALAWLAGLPCREPAGGPIYGTQMVVLEDIDEAAQPSREALSQRVRERAVAAGLVRQDGFAFVFPGRGTALVNLTMSRRRSSRSRHPSTRSRGAPRPTRSWNSCAANIPPPSARRGSGPMAFPASARRAGSSGGSR